MKKKLSLLLIAPALLTSCGGIKPVYIYGQKFTSSDVFYKYSNLEKITSNDRLIYVDENGYRPYVFSNKQEADEYASLLREKRDSSTNSQLYSEMISYLDFLEDSDFNNKKLVISEQFDDAKYNIDSCRFERIYIKDNNLFIYLIREFMNKGGGLMYYEAYTFFIDKDVNVDAAYVMIDESYLKY